MAGTNLAGIRHEVVTIEGSRIAYSSAGHRGTPIVLVHGGAGDRDDWAGTIRTLAASHRVYAPDMIGYGQSSRPAKTYTLQHFSRFLLDFMDALDLDQAALVGHSLGGRVCLEVARQEPDRVAGLVLVAPIGFGKLFSVGLLLGVAGWALCKAMRRPLPYPALDVELEERGPDRFRNVKSPTLIVWGSGDIFFPPKHGKRALSAIPNSTLRLFRHSRHAPHRDEPAAFNRVVLEFLATAASEAAVRVS